MNDLLWKFLNIRVYQERGLPSLHKPLLLLYALGKLIQENQRLISFIEIDSALSILLKEFHPSGSNQLNTHYPFGKLENDGIWEVEQSISLKRTAVGHLFKSEIIEKGIRGGFNVQVFNTLISNKNLAHFVAQALARKYFRELEYFRVLDAVGIKEIHFDHLADIVDAVSTNQDYANRICAVKLNGAME
ncbi:hypothetical protein CKO09_02230 [Chromatium weissei]|nr:hypothetical protein [Chromatium weissei]